MAESSRISTMKKSGALRTRLFFKTKSVKLCGLFNNSLFSVCNPTSMSADGDRLTWKTMSLSDLDPPGCIVLRGRISSH